MDKHGIDDDDLRQSCELDTLYGLPVAPTTIDILEKKVKPTSLAKLDQDNAQLLKQLMTTIAQGLGIAGYAYSEIAILWVIDRSGTLWFSLEEALDHDTKKFAFAVPTSLIQPLKDKLKSKFVRLGHPALIGATEGRIGGELRFDINDSLWYLSNRSGRYGYDDSRTATHLENVANKFSKYGISLITAFVNESRGVTP